MNNYGITTVVKKIVLSWFGLKKGLYITCELNVKSDIWFPKVSSKFEKVVIYCKFYGKNWLRFMTVCH